VQQEPFDRAMQCAIRLNVDAIRDTGYEMPSSTDQWNMIHMMHAMHGLDRQSDSFGVTRAACCNIESALAA
jgi:hypothetical protein